MNRRSYSLKQLFFSICYFVMAGIILAGCSSKQDQSNEPELPNILWITAEDIGPGLGCYGAPNARTPNLDKLAADGGIVYHNAMATAPICSPARSSIITGMYPTSLGTQHLRSEIPIPEFVDGIPEYLRKRGYYCTNSGKTDYNFDAGDMWDDNRYDGTHWRNRPEGKPFFSVFNYGVTHEGHTNKPKEADFKNLDSRLDPKDVKLPPYFPDSPEMRKTWARQYDLITVMDQRVGELIDSLKADGLYENTIIFFYGDHGYGMPRYKRWLNITGLQVPFVVRVPEQYQHLVPKGTEAFENRLVSFADLAPTLLNMVDIDIPDHMHGQPFLGKNADKEKEYIYASRSRADDVYDVSRAILNKDYIYIRHFMPHHPYVVNSFIFDESKASFKELRRLRQKDSLNAEANGFFEPKPIEELYDLQNDPHELNNLANDPTHRDVLEKMQSQLRASILSSRDIGFLNEAEMMDRGQASTPYEYAQTEDYNLEAILSTAELVGREKVSVDTLASLLLHEDSGVRFWAMTGLIAKGNTSMQAEGSINKALNDASPIVQIKAAEYLVNHSNTPNEALEVLSNNLKMADKPWLVLQAAISVRRIGAKATPIIPVVKEVLEKNSGDAGRGYKDWFYAMFIGFALDQVMINCGEV